MNKKYYVTIIKDKQVVRHLINVTIDIAIDYFKMYNSQDYYISVVESNTNEPVLFKREGISL